jgi:hypothetical protein
VLAAARKDHGRSINALIVGLLITAFFRRWRPRRWSRQAVTSCGVTEKGTH